MPVSRCATLLTLVGVLFSFNLTCTNITEAQSQVFVERQPSAEEQADARALFHQAVEAFDAGDFDGALQRFERSYELSQRPVLLYNIGSAADRLRNDDRAISAFRAYLEALPNADNAASVRSRLAHLEQAGGSSQVERIEASEAPVVEATPLPAEVEPILDVPLSVDGTSETSAVAPELPAKHTRIGPLALLISGGAIALAGGAFFATGYAGARSVEAEMQPEWADVEDRVNRAQLFLNLGYAFVGVGAALLVGGGIWWAMGDDSSVELAVSPAGLSVRGAF